MKKSIAILIATVLCIAVLQNAFASDTSPKDEFIEALRLYPTIHSLDVLQFLQAYLNPDNPKEFFLEATGYSDEEIDDIYVIFLSFFDPKHAGVEYWLFCDVEANYESRGKSVTDENDPNGAYALNDMFEEDLPALADIFPRGIGRTNAYDTFRRCAIHLAVYADRYGGTPAFQTCYDYIDYILSYYEQQFNEGMEAEAAAEETEAN